MKQEYKVKLYVEVDVLNKGIPNVDKIIEKVADKILEADGRYRKVKVCGYEEEQT